MSDRKVKQTKGLKSELGDIVQRFKPVAVTGNPLKDQLATAGNAALKSSLEDLINMPQLRLPVFEFISDQKTKVKRTSSLEAEDSAVTDSKKVSIHGFADDEKIATVLTHTDLNAGDIEKMQQKKPGCE